MKDLPNCLAFSSNREIMIKEDFVFRHTQHFVRIYFKEEGFTMKKIITFVVVLFMIGMVNTGFCQMKQGAVEISPFIGGFHYEGNQDFNKHVIYGARLGYAFTDNFSGELVGNLGKTYYTEFEPNVRMHTYNYRLEGLYHFMPASRFVPFVALGFGGQRNDPFERSNDDKWRLVGDYGAGVKFFFTEHIALRADVRHILASGSIYNNLEYTLGLSFLFGGEKPAPVPVAAPVAVRSSSPPPSSPPRASCSAYRIGGCGEIGFRY